MFMNARPISSDQATASASPDADGVCLLGVVRALIDYGRDLVSTLRQSNAPAPSLAIARRFGCLNLALIIARITRGLMLAAALERRLLHPRPRSADPVRRAAPASPRASRAPRRPQPDEEAELLGDLPTAREIAARIRGRRIGAVLAEICRDLGIDGEHALWPEVYDAIPSRGGNLMTLLRVLAERGATCFRLGLPVEPDPRYDQVMAALTNPS